MGSPVSVSTSKSPQGAKEWGDFLTGRDRLFKTLMELHAKVLWRSHVKLIGAHEIELVAYAVGSQVVIVRLNDSKHDDAGWDVYTSVAPNTLDVDATLDALRTAVAK